MQQIERILQKKPEQSGIEVERRANGLHFKLPKYSLGSTDWMITLYSLFWIVVFGAGVYAAFFWYDPPTYHSWKTIPVKITGLLVAAGLFYWIASEINAFNEQQFITITNDKIRIDKQRLFWSSHFEQALTSLREINIEKYPVIYYSGQKNVLFMEFSEEEEQVWMVKLLKIWIQIHLGRKI